MSNIGSIIITDKINQSQLSDAFNIYYIAFKRKIRSLIKIKETAISIYEKSLNPDRVLYALSGDRVVGVIGLHYDNKNFMKIKYEYLREHYNPIHSYFIYFVYRIFAPKLDKDVVRIDSVAVDEDLRGQGIGTHLIKKVFEFANERRFKEVILEVVNTNPEAKRLYERLGFKEKKLVKYYFAKRPAGFSSEFVMSYKIEKFSD